jgi:hypothetical protein
VSTSAITIEGADLLSSATDRFAVGLPGCREQVSGY